MHNLFLGLIKEHFTGILGIGLSKFQEKPVISLAFEAPPPDMASQNKKGVEKLKRILEAPVAIMLPNENDGVKKLKSVNLPVLKFVTGQVECQLPNKNKFSKADYAKSLYDWVSSNVFLVSPPDSTKPACQTERSLCNRGGHLHNHWACSQC